MKTLIKLDLLMYLILSLAAFIGGIQLLTNTYEPSPTAKNIENTFDWMGGIALFIGIAGLIVTFIKIKDTYSKQ